MPFNSFSPSFCHTHISKVNSVILFHKLTLCPIQDQQDRMSINKILTSTLDVFTPSIKEYQLIPSVDISARFKQGLSNICFSY